MGCLKDPLQALPQDWFCPHCSGKQFLKENLYKNEDNQMMKPHTVWPLVQLPHFEPIPLIHHLVHPFEVTPSQTLDYINWLQFQFEFKNTTFIPENSTKSENGSETDSQQTNSGEKPTFKVVIPVDHSRRPMFRPVVQSVMNTLGLNSEISDTMSKDRAVAPKDVVRVGRYGMGAYPPDQAAIPNNDMRELKKPPRQNHRDISHPHNLQPNDLALPEHGQDHPLQNPTLVANYYPAYPGRDRMDYREMSNDPLPKPNEMESKIGQVSPQTSFRISSIQASIPQQTIVYIPQGQETESNGTYDYSSVNTKTNNNPLPTPNEIDKTKKIQPPPNTVKKTPLNNSTSKSNSKKKRPTSKPSKRNKSIETEDNDDEDYD
jgi:hypothetical protein